MSGIFYNNQRVIVPGVVSSVNADAMVQPNNGPSRTVTVIGTALGGTPGKITTIRGTDEIRSKLIGGEGTKLVRLVMNPSEQLPGASEVNFIRVGNPTQATASLGNGTLKSKLYGKAGNATRYKHIVNTDGSVDFYHENTYLKKVEADFRGLGPVIELTYVGSAANPTVEVTGTTDRTLVLTGDEPTSFTKDMTERTEDLISAINLTSEWVARPIGMLRNVPFDDLLAQTYTLTDEKTQLSIGGKALEYALEDSSLLEFTFDPASAPNAVNNWKFMAGGTEGTAPTVADWIAAIDLAKLVETHSLVLGTGNTSVVAAAKDHVKTMGDARHRKERFLYCGPAKSTTKTGFKAAVAELTRNIGGSEIIVAANEPRIINDETGKPEVYPAYYYAAMLAGMKAGNRPEVSPTNKQVRVDGFNYQWDTDELEELLTIGACPAHYNEIRGEWVCTQGKTSYTATNNSVLTKQQGVDISHTISKLIRYGLDSQIGERGNQATINSVLNIVLGVLNSQVASGNNPDGLITAGVDDQGNPEPAYKNVQVIYGAGGNDVVGVTYEAHPVGEVAYITVTAYLTPIRIIAAA